MQTLRSLCALLLAVSLSIVGGCQGSGGGGGEATLSSIEEWINVDDAAPTFDALRGKPVVVEFWATWCGPCVKSVPHLVELHDRYAEDGLTILGIHAQRGSEDRAAIEDFIERMGMAYAVGIDRDGTVMQGYGVSGIPDAFVYSREGELVWTGHPLSPSFTKAVESVL